MSGNTENGLNAIKALPVLEPPPAAEAATLAAMAAAAARAARSTRPAPATWAIAASLIVALGIAALIAAVVLDGARPGPATPTAAVEDAELDRLLESSAYLEQLLVALPQRQLMRVSTAGTIVGLEERLALIDGALVRAEAEDVPPGYRAALLRDRIDVMNALVTVRYAQSSAFYF